jgi:beta-phosphoglucomutase
MNRRIKGLIFDLDGVLVTTEHNHFIAWKNTAEILEIGVGESFIEDYKSKYSF